MPRGGAQTVAVVCLLAVVSALALPVFDKGFVYDDDDVIERGDVIHDPSEILNLFRNHTMYVSPRHRGEDLSVDTYRPVTLVSFMWDSALSGREPWAYHLTNLSMHLLCTVLVFLLVVELLGGGRWPFALVAAAWFALSPHPSTAHIWINGRSDLFCTAFGLGAILVWRKGLRTGKQPLRSGWLGLAALLFFAGLLSKESLLFTVPALFLWPEPKGAVSWRERAYRSAGFAAAALGYLGARAAVLGGMRSNDGFDHLIKSLTFLAPLQIEGLWGALWPRRLHLRFLGEELGALGTLQLGMFACAFALLAVGVWLLRKRLPLVAWGSFWFVSCLAPVTIVAGLLWPGFGRYLYLPSVGLAVALGSLAVEIDARLRGGRPGLILAALAYLAFLAFQLQGWIRDFRNPETLYMAAVTKNPNGAHAYGWLGMHYFSVQRLEDSIGPLAVAHQRAPEEVRYAETLFTAFVKLERWDAAGKVAQESAPRYERDASVFHMFLLNAAHRDQPEIASFHVLECLRKDPSSADCGRALEGLLTSHPLKLRYRELVRAQLQQERLAAVRRQTDPLMRSLP